MDELSDYWERVKTGDDKAFAQLFNLLWKEMFGYAARLMQDNTEAQDIVQELFTQLWEKRESLSTVDKIKPYLYQWMRHSILNRIQEQGIRKKHLEAFRYTVEETTDTTFSLLVENDLQQQILKSINSLPDRMREVFWLSRMEHLSVSEIASKLNISEQTVRNQINIAVNRIKTVITYVVLLILQS
jgi:RNA polymerase sigma-70 factor (family 1)